MKIYGGFCFLFLIFLYLCNCLTIPNVRMNEDISNIEKTSRPSATLRPELQRTSEEPEKQQDLQMHQLRQQSNALIVGLQMMLRPCSALHVENPYT